jgi:DUF4097 and DUF4098 domain-containing protein YvlB
MKASRAIVLLAALFLLSSLVFADDWNKTYNLTGKPTLKVETSDANIRVTASDRNTIEARITTEGYKIGPDGIRITETQAGNIIDIQVRYPHHDVVIGWSHHKVEVEIQVPREATIGLRTGDGRITVSGVKGDVDAWSGDGAQQIDSVDGNLRAHTGDGRITVSGRFDSLELNTGDGRIEATALPNSTLSHDWNLHTGDGSVRLLVPQTLAADIDLHTSDGHISLDLPLEVNGGIRTNNIHGKINGGGRLLTVHTGDGSITLGRS